MEMSALAAAYVRVSTQAQEAEAQRRALEEFAKSRGFALAWFVDEAVSGSVKAMERPGFASMARFLEANPGVKDVVVFDLSRLGRDYDDLKEVLRYLSSRGCRLWVAAMPSWNELMEGLRASGDNPLLSLLYKLLADILVSVMSFASAQERVLTSMRTRAGLEKARAGGKRLGRPPYPFPEDYVKQLLKKGLPLTKVWRLLVAEGKICREADGERDCMRYETFRRKVRELRVR
ncbi:MAG: recombinase family protein [Candidatus Nezhaarchaeota archaeon]|nr:recombinase family protein [Candidatus Nezhaarchaeota archaeon]